MSPVRPAQPVSPAAPKGILCPYCGRISVNPKRCDGCGGFFDPLSRQATQNAMGPWFLRDPANPHGPGCSYETLKELVKRGRIRPDTILRGPTTRQFWNFAARTPTVANLLGLCHNCHSKVSSEDYSCAACGAVFTPETDRQHLGLAPVHLLPGQAAPEIIAASVEPPPDLTEPPPPRVRPRPEAAPYQGRSAIESEPPSGGGAVGKTFAILGILVFVAAAVAGVVYVTQQLNPSAAAPAASNSGAATARGPVGAGVASPARGSSTEPVQPGPNPTTAAVPDSSASGATGAAPASESQPAAQPATEAPHEPSPSPAPSESPKTEGGPASELIQRLVAAPDAAALNAVALQVRDRAPQDAAAWESLIQRRAEQLRLRGLP